MQYDIRVILKITLHCDWQAWEREKGEEKKNNMGSFGDVNYHILRGNVTLNLSLSTFKACLLLIIDYVLIEYLFRIRNYKYKNWHQVTLRDSQTRKNMGSVNKDNQGANVFFPKNVGYLSNSRKELAKILGFLNDSDLQKKVSHLRDLHNMGTGINLDPA